MNPADAWKRWVPPDYQQHVLEARVQVRRWIDPSRQLPDFLVIGAQRAGTSSLYKYLEQHPDVVASLRKETNYFNFRSANGEGWYRAHFASRWRRALERRRRGREPLSFEATSGYLFHPQAPARAAALVPEAKLVVLVRNPVDRAVSHYRHEVRAGTETLSFEEALDREPERLAGEAEKMAADPRYRSHPWDRFAYVARGRYAEQLERWRRVFPPDRFLVVKSEDLYEEPAKVYREILRFLDLPEWTPTRFRNYSYPGRPPARPDPVAAPTRQRLAETFAPHNRQLYAMVGRDLGWDG